MFLKILIRLPGSNFLPPYIFVPIPRNSRLPFGKKVLPLANRDAQVLASGYSFL